MYVPSNPLSSAMDRNFDTYFLTIFSQGWKLSTQCEKVNGCMGKSHTDVLKGFDVIAAVQFILQIRVEDRNSWIKAFTLVGYKSFCVSEFGKVAVTSKQAESNFLRPLLCYNWKLDFIISYHLQKWGRDSVTKTYLREKPFFPKKWCRPMGARRYSTNTAQMCIKCAV
jgi:hypothetical protein